MGALVYVLSAFGLGALHALEPGHGKTMVAAYLVGSKGRPQDAVLLGIVVTLTHTLGVFVLALLSLTMAALFVPNQVERYLEIISGSLVLAVGIWMLWQRVLAKPWQEMRHGLNHRLNMAHNHGSQVHHDHDHSHDHGHAHHDHDHSPVLDARGRLDMRGLVALGISGGIVPCPTAMAVLLAALSAGKISSILSGMGLVVVFSLGLASVLIALGLAAVLSVDWLKDHTGAGEFIGRYAGQASAWLVFVLGIFLTVKPLLA